MLGDINVGTVPEPEALEAEATVTNEMTVVIDREFMGRMLEVAEQEYPDKNLVEVAIQFEVLASLIKKELNIIVEE